MSFLCKNENGEQRFLCNFFLSLNAQSIGLFFAMASIYKELHFYIIKLYEVNVNKYAS